MTPTREINIKVHLDGTLQQEIHAQQNGSIRIPRGVFGILPKGDYGFPLAQLLDIVEERAIRLYGKGVEVSVTETDTKQMLKRQRTIRTRLRGAIGALQIQYQ